MSFEERWRREGERGEAIVEFATLTVLMVVLVAQLIVALARVEAGAFATEAAARELARLSSQGADAAAAAAPFAVELAFTDQGLDPSKANYTLTCVTRCGQPGEKVSVEVTYRLRIPGIGMLLPERSAIPMRAHYVVELGEALSP
ncbi:MAG: hypothetical protein Q3999_05890 [Buchananella hordeovulneris]|nr:hypothetical protein [Buchananella hordeovulneris]